MEATETRCAIDTTTAASVTLAPGSRNSSSASLPGLPAHDDTSRPAEAGGGGHSQVPSGSPVHVLIPDEPSRLPAPVPGDRPAAGCLRYVQRTPALRFLGFCLVRNQVLDRLDREAALLRDDLQASRQARTVADLNFRRLAGVHQDLQKANTALQQSVTDLHEKVRRIRDQVARHDEEMNRRLADAETRAARAEARLAEIAKSAMD